MNPSKKRIFVFDSLCVNENYKPLKKDSFPLPVFDKYKDCLLIEKFDIDNVKWNVSDKHNFVKDILILLQFTEWKPDSFSIL